MNRALSLTLLLSLGIGVLTSSPAQCQEVYKSTDAQGHVIYSDHPTSAASQRQSVDVVQPDKDEAARLEKQRALEDADYAQRSRDEADQQRKQAAQDKQTAERCKAARSRYLSLKDLRRLYRLDDAGNRVYYSDAELDAMRVSSKQTMDQACGT
ncbi:MAG TPA: DUF4124 domain-containing protein [Steroidobacteraceae bacterium]|jgi:hypothetical protein